MATRQALAILRRHAWLAAIVFVVIFAGAVTVAMSLPDIARRRRFWSTILEPRRASGSL